MATNTENLGLIKPTQEDFYNIDDFNENFQKIDEFLERPTFPNNVNFKKYENGRGVIRKNHSETVDYGTEIVDYDKDGNSVKLVVKAKNTFQNKIGFGMGDAFYSIFGEHNSHGLGTDILFVNNANDISSTGFYYTNVNTPGSAWSYINHYQYPTTGYALQVAYGVDSKVRCTRSCENGVWGEWEYENPPMIPGVEYRTTKRHNGNPVYTKLINFGVLSDEYKEGETTQTKSIETGITGHIVSLKGTAMSIIGNKVCYDAFPVINVLGKLMAITYTRESQLYVTTYENCSGVTAEHVIEYTK